MVYSVDRIPGAEALAVHNILAALISFKLKQEYSELCEFVRERMSLVIVSSNSLLLRGPQDTEMCIQKRPDQTDGALMVLITHWNV